jgi:integrase
MSVNGKFDDFAKNEGIFLGRHITPISVTLNGVTRRSKHFGIGVHTNGHLHKFRDSAATRSLRAGIDVRTVQARLGYESLATTQKYLEPSKGDAGATGQNEAAPLAVMSTQRSDGMNAVQKSRRQPKGSRAVK